MRALFTFGVSILGIVLLQNDCPGRLVESWPYERLVKEAHLVVIAEPLTEADSGETVTPKNWKTEFIGVNTTFVVQGTLKGKNRDKLTVLHYRLPHGVRIINGPGLVSFSLGGRRIITNVAKTGWTKSHYLLFLKQRKDGRFEPVSGIIDPEMSVQEVVSANTLNRLSRPEE